VNETLDELRSRLHELTLRLRSGDASAEEVLAVIEECAGLAGEAAGGVQDRVRAAAMPLPGMPGQLPLAEA
jgi:hypothetical protein